MNVLLVISLSLGAPVAAFALHDLQARLERWDYERHAQD